MASKASKITLGYESGTGQSTLLATWAWSGKNTKQYNYQWQYIPSGGNGWLLDNEGSINSASGVPLKSTCSVKNNALKYRFRVKPIAKTHTVKKTKKVKGKKKTVTSEVAYWTADWSTWKEIDIRNQAPETPPTPSYSFTNNNSKVVVSVENLPTTGINIPKKIGFELYNITNSITAGYKEVSVSSNGRAAHTFDLTRGKKYRVRCLAIDSQGQMSGYTDRVPYSPDSITALPSAPSGITKLKVVRVGEDKQVEIDFDKPDSTVTSYELQYTKNSRYFDVNPSEVHSVELDASTGRSYIITLVGSQGLEDGNTWYFRLRAKNETGNSEWTEIVSITIGEKTEAPTTWALAATVVTGDDASLYWVHNTVDGSKETYAQLKLKINGIEQPVITIQNTRDADETIGQYVLNTSEYINGASIEWQVRTKGIYEEYGDWSVSRTLNVVAQPTLEFAISQENNWYWDLLNFNTGNIFSTEGSLGEETNTITEYPFYISALAGPNTQNVLRWYVSIIADDESHESLNEDGTLKVVNKGDIVYSKHFDNDGDNRLFLPISAADVILDNNCSYVVNVRAVMDTGLYVEDSKTITIALDDDEVDIYASVEIDEDFAAAFITPYALDPEDDKEEPLTDLYFSIYRINFDGTFTEILTRIDSTLNITAVDLHPSLDRARYRIVAISKSTGKVTYDDFSEEVGESDIIIQWNERKRDDFVIDDSGDATDEPIVSGEFLRLPWNIDTSEAHAKDNALVEYIGREHPVSYYGTQLGETATWNTDVDKEDTETIYALRRLAIYQGDVYVREPSGVGYWAQIGVSMTNTHAELVIPVTLTITRVEGGA